MVINQVRGSLGRKMMISEIDLFPEAIKAPLVDIATPCKIAHV